MYNEAKDRIDGVVFSCRMTNNIAESVDEDNLRQPQPTLYLL